MSLLFCPHHPSLFHFQNPKPSLSASLKSYSLSLSSPCPSKPHNALRFSKPISVYASSSEPAPDRDPDSDPSTTIAGVTDEWGEKAETTPEPEPTKAPESDPPMGEDEWEEEYVTGNGSATQVKAAEEKEVVVDERLADLKRCLVDTVFDTELGFRAGPEVRAEVLELVNQLEAANPTPAPVESPELLNGNWVLLYTASSELLPLLAAGSTPLLKVKSISQNINSSNLSIVNSATLAGPFATFSFSATAEFEVRSPLRIQVEFKEGAFQPPDIKPNIDVPENVDIFGQNISLSQVQQSLGPLEGVVQNISRTISGQPPLKVPIPGNRTQSWLLITYLDKDFRISRGDGGLFVLAKEGSPLLDQ